MLTEKQKEYQKDYYSKNKEKCLAQRQAYRKTEAYKINKDKRYWDNPEKYTEYQKTLRLQKPKAHIVIRTRASAKRRGLEHTITENDFEIPSHCPLLGIPLQQQEGLPTDNSPALDRIDSTKGYIPGNVWIISHRANTIKTNASLEELERIVINLKVKHNIQD